MANEKNKKGKLTLFISYTPGAGKSYIMLSMADREKVRGKKVVVAFLNDTHREAYNCLEQGGTHNLKISKNSDADVKNNNYNIDHDLRRKKPKKYSLSEILASKPDLVLLDEMGMGGINRDERTHVYDDIQKLLNAGIDVYSTANLKRFDNMNPLFKKLSGIGIKKTIPGRFLDIADKIIFIDRNPKDMIQDFEEGLLFNTKYMESGIMKKNFRMKTLEEYRNLSMKILEDYKDKVEIVINNFERKE